MGWLPSVEGYNNYLIVGILPYSLSRKETAMSALTDRMMDNLFDDNFSYIDMKLAPVLTRTVESKADAQIQGFLLHHISTSVLRNTGPSLQIRLLWTRECPSISVDLQTQARHAPIPQAILSSMEIQQGIPFSSA